MAEPHKKFITNTDTSSNSKISDFISNANDKKVYNESENIQPHRQFFNSVTGALMPEGVNEEDMYEVDLDDQREQEENQIDQYTDVSDKDKLFYKVWNRFIKHKDKSQIYMEGYLLEFVKKNGIMIIEKELKECLLLHLTCLFDYGQINKNVFINVINEILKIEKEIHSNH